MTGFRQTPSGILFDGVDSTPAYLSRTDHRRLADGARNKWAIRPPDEYEVFATSHSEQWLCASDHNWGLRGGLEVIGTNGEAIAKFPRASNPTDERHGYPVSARDKFREFEHRPPANLTAEWRDQGLISDLQKARIDRGKV